MTAENYLQNILSREAVDTGLFSPVRNVQSSINPLIQRWAGNRLMSISPSGSFAKGTANLSGTDIDLFISLSSQTSETLKDIYNKLFNYMNSNGYNPKRQNVSINVHANGYDVDLVPAKRQDSYSDDHSLYRRRANTWTKTNVAKHIAFVSQSGRTNEIRIVKLWRDQNKLDFPSFYLELSVIEALSGRFLYRLSDNVWETFKYLRDNFSTGRLVDPANTNNLVSDDLTAGEKGSVKAAAVRALKATDWSQIVV
jgi:hypothetical protein